jgi:GntR family transcriptional regulator, transcriptional repressor for pyruvate dehydrogenase complex
VAANKRVRLQASGKPAQPLTAPVGDIEAESQPRLAKTGALVAERLRSQIVRGELNVGDRLPSEDELTAHYGIARTTLREALRILESQHLIEIRRGRGGGPVITRPEVDSLAAGTAVLLQLQGTTVGDVDRARAMVEPQLAAQLAANHTQADLDALTETVALAATAAENQDRMAFGLAVAQLHEMVMERAGNNTMALFSRLMHGIVERYYIGSASTADGEQMQRAVRSYRKLISLIEAGDGPAVEEHWRKQMAFTSTRRDPHAPLDLFEA